MSIPLAFIPVQHADDAAFLWFLRDRAVLDPSHDLEDLAFQDERIEAHMDGLRVAGDPGWEISLENLSREEPGEVFVASLLAFESNSEKRLDPVLEVALGSKSLIRPVISALGWMDWEQACRWINTFAGSDNPLLRRIAIAAAGIHRQTVDIDIRTLLDDQPVVKSRALRYIGETGQHAYLSILLDKLNDPDPACSFWAAWSASLFRNGAGLNRLWQHVDKVSEYTDRAVNLIGRLSGQTEVNQLHEKLQTKNPRIAIKLASASGDPVRIPWLIELLNDGQHASFAGAAFSTMTGADMAEEKLEKKTGDSSPADSAENKKQIDADDDLPCPDPSLVLRWWKSHQRNFANGRRYLLGKEISPDGLQSVLRHASQARRADAALEWKLQNPKEALFEVRSRAERQMQALGLYHH